ncbi:hypothetical protein K461DRAFT_308701 [Myriangium duriaei CBS 260.36]|uniref:SAC domain-containing protein n=1 Tax=Myriangium duriaei CBS 260.36 TaxID=1168546 RepID=A0A9P4IYJ5_9PEZI|nr:hypothetical protein K461DRAFT_308701 [Myriangium duriaei CBS 260.36]
MPGLVRKLLICATAQGLLLQPVSNRGQHSNSLPLVVNYEDCSISPSLKQHDEKAAEGLESHGLIGILNLSSSAYLISITQRKQVAHIRGKPIYVVTDVSFIPITSQSDAQSSINQARKALKQGKELVTSDDETDDETDDHTSTAGTDDGHDTLPPTPMELPGATDATKGIGPLAKGSTVAADVIKDRGKYGRFAERWFSKAGWTASGREKLGMSRSEDDLTREQKRQGLNALPDEESSTKADAPKELDGAADSQRQEEHAQEGPLDKAAEKVEQTVAEGIVKSLTPRILRTLRVFLSSESFYFSYDHDISRRLETQEPSSSTLPLHKRFDPLYFWNQHLLLPFIDSGNHAFVLPLIQGFVGQRAFTIGKTPKEEPDKITDVLEDPGEVFELYDRTTQNAASASGPVSAEPGSSADGAESRDLLLTLISRRSINRAGLRYLRRGVDDAGNVANNVETEQILSDQLWNESSKVFSLAQLRGSIPLFFSQSPYSFKPAPITYGSEATNHEAFNKHFSNLISKYGKIQIASLVDKHGTEKKIGELYQHHVEMTNEGQLPSHGFPGPDTSAPARPFSPSRPSDRHLAYTWFDFHHECRAFNFQNVSYLLDCLGPSLSNFAWTEQDSSRITRHQSGIIRTNCMDCLDRTNVVQSAIAGHILQQQLASFGLSIDLSTDPKTQWFNTLWADNGDAISRQYAGTAALKGDYTRTRKRNWTGAINDFSLTLGRYYNNIFSDYFLQTTIDYMLGLGDETIWEEFETDMVTGDHALDMSRVRQAAVERCVKVVLGRDAESDGDDSSTEATSKTAAVKTRVRKTLGRKSEEEEDLISGWTLHTPSQSNTLRSLPLEECVLLLTDQALYAVRFDWNTEKVGSYERVALSDIKGIRRGVYVTSTLGVKNMDEERNRGFVVTYREKGRGIRRVNTRSLSSAVVPKEAEEETPADAARDADQTEEGKGKQTEEGKGTEEKDFAAPAEGEKGKDTKILAFKSLSPRATAMAESGTRRRSVGSSQSSVAAMSERQVVEMVTEEVVRAIRAVRERREEEGEMWAVEDEAIISVAEARKSTGYLESIGYSLRRLVWA